MKVLIVAESDRTVSGVARLWLQFSNAPCSS
jgi:hypothetical protein